MRLLKIPILATAVLAIAASALTAGCAGTRAAYKAADGDPVKTAYVVSEHYSALVKEAADARDAGTLTGRALSAVQEADTVAKPLILKLGRVAVAYQNVRSAENEAALQAAVNAAAIAVSDFVTTLKTALKRDSAGPPPNNGRTREANDPRASLPGRPAAYQELAT